MKVWRYICEDCGYEDTYAEDEFTEECPECYGVMWNTDNPEDE